MARNSILTLAALILSASVFGGAAYAGGGKSLNFGGPLGTFVAKPTHGGGSSAPASKQYSPSKSASKKHHVPAKTVVKKHKAPAAQAHGGQNKKVVRTKHEVTPKASVAAKSSSETKAETEDAADETTEETSTGLTGSRALANQDAVESKEALDAKKAGEEPAVAAVEEPKEAAAEAPAATDDDTEGDGKELGCKKFIPAIGVTVSVGCNE